MAVSKIDALHCMSDSCTGMLAYEVTEGNVLYLDFAYTAERDGEVFYFPCPTCRGRNILEGFTDQRGNRKHRVARFAPAG